MELRQTARLARWHGRQRVERDPTPSWLARVVGVVAGPIGRLGLLVPTRRGRAFRHALAMQTTKDPARRARQARAALAAFEAAERRHWRRHPSVWRQMRRAASLPDIAMAALEAGEIGKAAAYAEEMLARGMGPVAPWNWNAGNLIHHGHITLGRLALKAGDVDAAEEHLRLAGSTHGSPQLDSFGPDFRLANELLVRGRTEVVLGYLALCRRFWTLGHEALDGWTAEIRAGHRPVLRGSAHGRRA
jgi:hypothetical protein